VTDWWRTSLTRGTTRLRGGGRSAVLWSARITAAAVASYVVATLLFPGTQPLTAPLTAMLVVQVTPVSLLASGLDRVVAVVAGVALAVAFSAAVPLEWWSLGLLILVCLTIGQALRLRSNLIEVAISGMLVLGVGAVGAESAAWQRLAVTLVGAAVGIATNLVFPTKVASADAGRAIDGLADSVSNLLSGAADELTALAVDHQDRLAHAATSWLDDARDITYHDIPRVGAALLHAEQGRRLNVRAVGTPDVGPGLRQGLEALEHSTVSIRGMFRALADAADDATWEADETTETVLLGLAQTFREMAAGVDAFGQLVHDEAGPARLISPERVQDLRDALEGLHEARARLTDVVLTGAPDGLLELHVAVLSTVKRLLTELDLAARIRRQIRMQPRSRSRFPGTVTPRSGRRTPVLPETAPDAETQVLPTFPDER